MTLFPPPVEHLLVTQLTDTSDRWQLPWPPDIVSGKVDNDRYDDGTYDEGVEEDTDRKEQGDLVQDVRSTEHKTGEGDGHDSTGKSNNLPSVYHGADQRSFVGITLQTVLEHTGDEEHIVIQGKSCFVVQTKGMCFINNS